MNEEKLNNNENLQNIDNKDNIQNENSINNQINDRSNQIIKLEEYRKELIRKKILMFILLFIIVGLMFYLKIATNFLEIIFLIVIAGIFAYGMSDYKKRFKDIFVKHALESTFEDLVYNPNYGISREKIGETNCMYMGDRFSSNDYIRGIYHNVPVELSDIHIEDQRTDSDGHTYYVTLFKGRWMIFNFNKNFVSNLTVCEKGFSNAKAKSLFSSAKKINMESILFNKQYGVYGLDEHTAFYLLTPQMQERLIRINEILHGELIFCFYDNKLHIGLNSRKDSFEPSLLKKIDEEKINTEVNKDINEIVNLVEEIKNDNSIFIK